MKSIKNIKQLIKKFHVTTNAKMDQKVREDVLEVIRKSKQTPSALTQPNIWRIIMKNRITKLAAVAVIIIAVLIGINQFGGSIGGDSVAFGDSIPLCLQCGQIKDSALCCQPNQLICPGCGLVKDSFGCCKISKGATSAAICTICGQIKDSALCCQPNQLICPSCGLVKGSPGCCKLPG